MLIGEPGGSGSKYGALSSCRIPPSCTHCQYASMSRRGYKSVSGQACVSKNDGVFVNCHCNGGLRSRKSAS
jgi:hypothetical protein